MKGKILLDEVIEKNGLKELVDKFYAKAGVTITKEMLRRTHMEIPYFI